MDFWMVASLDRFIKKRVKTNILFMTKQSRLAKISGPVFEWLKQNGGQNKMADHSKTGLFVQISNGD
jgi:hypothetical protein